MAGIEYQRVPPPPAPAQPIRRAIIRLSNHAAFYYDAHYENFSLGSCEDSETRAWAMGADSFRELADRLYELAAELERSNHKT